MASSTYRKVNSIASDEASPSSVSDRKLSIMKIKQEVQPVCKILVALVVLLFALVKETQLGWNAITTVRCTS